MSYAGQTGGAVQGLAVGAAIADRRKQRKFQEGESRRQQKNTETNQGLSGLEILARLSEHEATVGADLSEKLAQRGRLVQEESAASARLSLAEMSKDPGSIDRAKASHAKALGALEELDGFLSGRAAKQDAIHESSSLIRDFLTKNGLLNGLLEAKGTIDKLKQPDQSMAQPAPFTMPGMQQPSQGGQQQFPQGPPFAPGSMLPREQGVGLDISQSGFATPAVGGFDQAQDQSQPDVGAPGVDIQDDTISRGIMGEEQVAAPQNPSTPTDQVLSMWDQQASQMGMPRLGSPEARIENGTIVYTTNDSDIAANWEQRIKSLGQHIGGTPPMVVKDRGKILEQSQDDLARWAKLEGSQQARISAFERAKLAPQNVQDMRTMAELARQSGNMDDANTWSRAAEANEADRVRIINDAIKAAEPDLELYKTFRKRAQSLAEEYYQQIGAGALNPATKGAPASTGTAAQGLDRNSFLEQWRIRNKIQKWDPASARAAQAEWEALSGGR